MKVMRKMMYGYGAVLAMSLLAGGVILKNEKTQKSNYSERINNMEYVKHNAPQKYVEILERVNRSSSPRIVPENIDNIWKASADSVRDSITLSTKNLSDS